MEDSSGEVNRDLTSSLGHSRIGSKGIQLELLSRLLMLHSCFLCLKATHVRHAARITGNLNDMLLSTRLAV